MPLDKPVTTNGLELPVAVNPPGLDVAVYDVIAEPPSKPGALNATETCALPAVTDPMDGALGIVKGVTLLDASLAELVPATLVAVTVKVYAVPLERPVTVSGLEEPFAVNPPGLDVTV